MYRTAVATGRDDLPRLARNSVSDGIFRAAMISSLLFLVLFLVLVITSLGLLTTPDALLRTLLSSEILFAIRLSLVTATAATALSILIAIPAAHALSRLEFPGKHIVDTLCDLPVVISPVALGAALLVFFNTPLGAAIEDTLIEFVFQPAGIVLAQFTIVSALTLRLMKATFESIDPRYENVARTLGCNRLQAFFKVTLPLARNGLVAAIILTWARALGEFGATVTVAGAVRMKTETLPVAIYLSLSTADVNKAVAVIFVVIGVSFVALLGVRKLTGKGHRL